jgi:hypothetical protein
VCLPHGQEWERSQKVKKSMQKMLKKQREKANKTAKKLARTTEKLLLTELARSNQQNNSRASEVLRAIQASTNEVIDNAAEVAKAAAMATREVLDKVIEGSDQAELGRLEAEEQRLQDLVAKAAAKKLKFEEKQARDLTQKAVRDADAQAANAALVAAIGKQVGVAVKGEVGEVVEAVNAVGKQVDAAAEFAALGANAALEAANASKDAKEAIGALTSTFAGRMTEVLTVVLRRENTIKGMLEDPVGVNETRSIEDDPTIKQELALIKQSIADLRPQRAAPASQCTAPGQRAGSVPMRKPTSAPAPAPARSTRSATTGTRSGGATATTHSSQAARREQAPALKKGVLASKVSLAVEALAGDKKDGAYLKKIAALAEVCPTPSCRRCPLPPAAPCRTRAPLAPPLCSDPLDPMLYPLAHAGAAAALARAEGGPADGGPRCPHQGHQLRLGGQDGRQREPAHRRRARRHLRHLLLARTQLERDGAGGGLAGAGPPQGKCSRVL